jgi:cytochrome o ubiquinol oxidase subunit 1
VLGFMGATRRLDTYDASTGWQPLFVMMLLGGIVICIGVALQLAQIVASFIQKRRLRDTTGDPWNGRSMEWAVASPPPSYNFSVIPKVSTRDAFWEMKKRGLPKPAYEDILIPKNTGAGIYISIFAFFAGFGFVWEITWLAVVSIIAIIVSFIIRAFNEHSEYVLPASEVRELEEARIKKTSHEQPGRLDNDDDEDMGLRELIMTIFAFVVDVIKKKRWRTW